MEKLTQKNSYEEYIKHRYDDIIKPLNDERDYRGLKLTNDMKILLISDPQTDKSAACMNIQVGSMCDPPNLQGLAHFCEHMLFLGTEKYPKENDFHMYISQNGGNFNGSTSLENTTFSFELNTESLEGALDRFSQFFLEPLFSETNTEGEINNINSEYERNMSNDHYRLSQLEKFFVRPEHPFSYFSSGNIKSLKTIPEEKNIDVRVELINFHKRWYSANIMTLSVLGKEKLDDLEKIVVKLFAEVENKYITVPTWIGLPYDLHHLPSICYAVPVRKIRHLSISFFLPDLRDYYKSSPTDYISYLLGHEGEGSITHALKANGWCSFLGAGKSEGARGFNFFGFEIKLTEEGVNHIYDIITIIFQYISMLRSEAAKEWVFKEYTAIKRLNFSFFEKIQSRYYVKLLAENMVLYPMNEVLSGSYILNEWRPELVSYVLGYLQPHLIRVTVIAKEFKNIATETEPWYQTKFKEESIPSDVITKWKNADYSDTDFKLPDENEFIPTEFDLKVDNSNIDKFPKIIEDTPLMRVWFKQDNEFHLPKGILNFHFVSPFVYINPANYNNSVIFVRLVQESLKKYFYPAQVAGVKWSISNDKYGIKLFIECYSSKQTVLLNMVMNHMVNLKIDESKFNIIKEGYVRELKNFNATEPYIQAPYYLTNLLCEKFWYNDDLLNAVDKITVDNLRDFISQLFSNIHVECLVYGNFTEYEALILTSDIEYKLTSLNTSNRGNITPLFPSQLAKDRAIHLETGSHFLFEVENKISRNSCTLIYYQYGLLSTKRKILLELFAQIISEPLFTELRTKEQLGYIVRSKIIKENEGLGLSVIVQSNRHPQYVEERIDSFMNSMKEHIINMSDEEFLRHKESLAVKIHEKPKSMGELSAFFWKRIFSKVYDFDRASLEAQFLAYMTKEDILEFYVDVINDKSENKKKLTIHIISNMQKDSEARENTGTSYQNRIKIKDVVSYKNSQYLYPLLHPFVSLKQHSSK